MAVGLKNIYLALLFTFFTTVYAASETKGGCEKPLVRREFRSLSEGERKEWIDAVKVKNQGAQQFAIVIANSAAIVSRQEASQVYLDAHRQRFHLTDSAYQPQELPLRWYG